MSEGKELTPLQKAHATERHRRAINTLEPAERAKAQFDCHELFIRKTPYTKISEEKNLSIRAVKQLIAEYQETLKIHRPDTRLEAEETYNRLVMWAWPILEQPKSYSPLLVSKAAEMIMQAQTRKDKMFGHESPQMHVTSDVKTAKEIVQQYVNSRYQAGVSTQEMNTMEDYLDEEVQEGEIVDGD